MWTIIPRNSGINFPSKQTQKVQVWQKVLEYKMIIHVFYKLPLSGKINSLFSSSILFSTLCTAPVETFLLFAIPHFLSCQEGAKMHLKYYNLGQSHSGSYLNTVCPIFSFLKLSESVDRDNALLIGPLINPINKSNRKKNYLYKCLYYAA